MSGCLGFREKTGICMRDPSFNSKGNRDKGLMPYLVKFAMVKPIHDHM